MAARPRLLFDNCAHACGCAGSRYPFLTAKERDVETGLDYFEARYYSSTQGRFTSADPIFIKSDRVIDPQRLNLYAYVRNNPLVYVDPDGRDLQKGAKFDQRIEKALVELAKRADGRKLLERLDKLSAKIELNSGKAYDDRTGKEVYGNTFSVDRVKITKDGDINGSIDVRLNFALADRDRNLKGAVDVDPPKNDAEQTTHELVHLKRTADGTDRESTEVDNKEIEDAVNTEMRSILKQPADIKDDAAKKFVQNILQPNPPPEKKPDQQER